jgi:transcriptional regulator
LHLTGGIHLSFEVYVLRARGSKEKQPATAIKISKNSIVLNKNVRELLKQPEAVELAYDPNTSMIRIRPTDGTGIQLKKTKVYAKGFLEHFGIKNYGKFIAEYHDNENSIYVNV